MAEIQPVTHPENSPASRPEASAHRSVSVASENPAVVLAESSAPVSPESVVSPASSDARSLKTDKGASPKSPTKSETPADQKTPQRAEAPKTKEQRAAKRLEKIVNHTKTYLSDMQLAYNVAGQRLGGQSVTGKILEGATVTGIGVGLEAIVQTAFSSVLGEIIGHIPGLGGRAAGVQEVEIRKKDPNQILEARRITGNRILLSDQDQVFVREKYQKAIDEHGNVISTDLRAKLRKHLEEQLGANKSGLRMHLVNGLMEGFDDTAVLATYGLINRITGFMFPKIPTEYYGASLALDFLGIGMSPDGTKTDATAGQTATVSAQPSGIRAEIKKGVEKGVKAGQKVLNFSNPVSLYGLSVMKSGAMTYLDTLKAVRAKRKEVESGKAPRVYVGEGAPRGYGQQHRPWEQHRDNRYRGNQARGGNHG